MWLSKMPFSDHHNYFSKRRREGTGEWPLQHDKYGAWNMSENSSIFWLRGGGRQRILSPSPPNNRTTLVYTDN